MLRTCPSSSPSTRLWLLSSTLSLVLVLVMEKRMQNLWGSAISIYRDRVLLAGARTVELQDTDGSPFCLVISAIVGIHSLTQQWDICWGSSIIPILLCWCIWYRFYSVDSSCDWQIQGLYPFWKGVERRVNMIPTIFKLLLQHKWWMAISICHFISMMATKLERSFSAFSSDVMVYLSHLGTFSEAMDVLVGVPLLMTAAPGAIFPALDLISTSPICSLS